jgi:hypothetical protein
MPQKIIHAATTHRDLVQLSAIMRAMAIKHRAGSTLMQFAEQYELQAVSMEMTASLGKAC